MTNTITTPARAGRERTCTQCGATYRSPRNSSRFCSTACRQKANRGTAPTGGPKAGPDNWSMITKVLHKVGFVGCIGPASTRSTTAPTYALLVPYDHAFEELSFNFQRLDWGIVDKEEFNTALRRDGIKPYQTRSDEAMGSKLWQDRQRQREMRAA